MPGINRLTPAVIQKSPVDSERPGEMDLGCFTPFPSHIFSVFHPCHSVANPLSTAQKGRPRNNTDFHGKQDRIDPQP